MMLSKKKRARRSLVFTWPGEDLGSRAGLRLRVTVLSRTRRIRALRRMKCRVFSSFYYQNPNMIFLLWSGVGLTDNPHSTPRRLPPQLVDAEWAWLR
jgi:hypothetical protein